MLRLSGFTSKSHWRNDDDGVDDDDDDGGGDDDDDDYDDDDGNDNTDVNDDDDDDDCLFWNPLFEFIVKSDSSNRNGMRTIHNATI